MRRNFVAVDRIEGEEAVLVSDDHAKFVVKLAELSVKRLREGDILSVSFEHEIPSWTSAVRHNAERRRRLGEVGDRGGETGRGEPH
jgi:hypothetical protein